VGAGSSSSSNSSGRFVWRIREFNAFLEKMRNCASFVLYSKVLFNN
jgi:hypothetical protein